MSIFSVVILFIHLCRVQTSRSLRKHMTIQNLISTLMIHCKTQSGCMSYMIGLAGPCVHLYTHPLPPQVCKLLSICCNERRPSSSRQYFDPHHRGGPRLHSCEKRLMPAPSLCRSLRGGGGALLPKFDCSASHCESNMSSLRMGGPFFQRLKLVRS